MHIRLPAATLAHIAATVLLAVAWTATAPVPSDDIQALAHEYAQLIERRDAAFPDNTTRAIADFQHQLDVSEKRLNAIGNVAVDRQSTLTYELLKEDIAERQALRVWDALADSGRLGFAGR